MRRLGDPVLLALLVGSLGLNVHLGTRLRRVGSPTPLPSVTTPIGHPVPPFSATRVRGGVEAISFAVDKPTVLYYFTPNCRWCRKNTANIKALAAMRSSDFRFIGIAEPEKDSLDSGLADVGAYIAREGIGFPVYMDMPEPIRKACGFEGTPTTVVVSPKGVVERYWGGAYNDRIRVQVEDYFRITLPGLAQRDDLHPLGP